MARLFLIPAIAGAFLLSLPAAAIAGDGQAVGSKASPRAPANLACAEQPRTNVAHSDVSQSTSSTAFVDVAGSSLTFNIGGTGSSCVLVSFSGQAFAPGSGTLMFVRALLDGALGVDDPIQFVAESGTLSDAHAYNFLFRSVSPGLHTVKMQFASLSAADTVTLNDFGLHVRHR